MVQQEEKFHVGHRVVATIKSVKGTCHWNHKAGDSFEISAHDTAGLCGLVNEFGSRICPKFGVQPNR